ncbi:hypothetical protein TIFTF001_040398 [Ficus carica]|uniref:Uncharacterized protein n=1 Tax=Ficus carica TaxID=3494 RepID=A0AA88CN89_FICCA|nr:hypothetical protein TIFTF001_040398 [Ficus carica]
MGIYDWWCMNVLSADGGPFFSLGNSHTWIALQRMKTQGSSERTVPASKLAIDEALTKVDAAATTTTTKVLYDLLENLTSFYDDEKAVEVRNGLGMFSQRVQYAKRSPRICNERLRLYGESEGQPIIKICH